MAYPLRGLMVLMLLAGSAPAVYAQAVAGPPNSVGGLFGGHRPTEPNRSSQRLSITFDVGTGYNSALDEVTTDGAAPLDEYATTVETVLRYWRGRPGRFFETSGRGFMDYQNTTNQEIIGGEALLNGAYELGQSTEISAGTTATYTPAMVGAPVSLPVGDEEIDLVPDFTPPIGVVDERWFTISGRVNAVHNWTVRQTTTADYLVSQRRSIEGEGLNSNAQSVMLLHSWNARPTTFILGSYRFDNNRQGLQNVVAPSLRTHSGDIGFRVERRFSPIRTLTFGLSGGATYALRDASLEAPAFTYVGSIYSATARFTLTRAWQISADVARDVTPLEGLTPEPFSSEQATLRLETVLTPRLSLGISGNLARGAGLQSTGSYESGSGSAQIQYGFASCCGVFTNYTYYVHRMRDLSSLPDGFPARYERHAVRVGFSLWLPLYGSF